jgi:hypothetical protein
MQSAGSPHDIPVHIAVEYEQSAVFAVSGTWHRRACEHICSYGHRFNEFSPIFIFSFVLVALYTPLAALSPVIGGEEVTYGII